MLIFWSCDLKRDRERKIRSENFKNGNFANKMQASRMPEHLQTIRGLFYSPTSESISGQMAIAASLASPTDLKSFQRKSQSRNKVENKHWLRASLKLWNSMDVQGQMSINHFQRVVDLYPHKKVVVYSSETNQPYPNGIFIGFKHNTDMEDDCIFIFHDLKDDHYTWIQNMQMFYQSINSHRDHLFCFKCFGWIRGSHFYTHSCIYEFRCFDCGEYKTIQSAAKLMQHRDRNVLGTNTCQRCGKMYRSTCSTEIALK